MKVKILLAILCFLVLASNAHAKTVVIKNVPYINQVEDVDKSLILGHNACAPAVAVMLLTYYGILPRNEEFPGYYIYKPYEGFTDKEGNDYSEEFAFDSDGVKGVKNKVYGAHGYIVGKHEGVWQAHVKDIIKYLENHGLEVEDSDGSTMFQTIVRNIDIGYPLIARGEIDGNGHYVLVVGYDDVVGEIIVHDPYGNANKDWFDTKAGGKYTRYPLDNNTASWAHVKMTFVFIAKKK